MDPLTIAAITSAAGAIAGKLTEDEKRKQTEEAAEKIKQSNKMRQLYDFGRGRYEKEIGPYIGQGDLATMIGGGAAGLGLGQSISQLVNQTELMGKNAQANNQVNNVLGSYVPSTEELLMMQQKPKYGLGFNLTKPS